MQKNHVMKFRVDKYQRDKIENIAKAKGYTFVASYLRDLALNQTLLIEAKIMETNSQIKKLLEAMQ